jgi:hypothetical protein
VIMFENTAAQSKRQIVVTLYAFDRIMYQAMLIDKVVAVLTFVFPHARPRWIYLEGTFVDLWCAKSAVRLCTRPLHATTRAPCFWALGACYILLT